MALVAEMEQKNSECLQEPTLHFQVEKEGVLTVCSIQRKISQSLGGARDSHDRAKVATVLGVETSTSLRSASSKTTYECCNCKKKGHLAAVCWEKLEPKDEPKHEQAHIVLTRRMTMKRPIQCIISAASQPNQ